MGPRAGLDREWRRAVREIKQCAVMLWIVYLNKTVYSNVVDCLFK